MKLPAFSPEFVRKAERWVILLIALTVFVTLGITLVASRRSLAEDITSIPVHAIWVLVALTAMETVIRFWRYHVTAKALKLGIPFWRLAYYYTVGFGLIPTPGKVGTAIRLWLIKQYHGLPYRRTAPLIVMDFVTDSIAMCSLAALSLLLLDDPRLNTVGILVGAALTFGLFATLVAPRFMTLSVKTAYLFTGKRRKRLFARILTLVRTTSAVLGPRLLLTNIALSFVGWGLIGIGVGYLVAEYGHPGFGAAAGTLAITLGTMGGFLTMMPAGVGGAEVTMAGLFTMFGVSLAQAVIVTAIVRLVVLWSTVLMGLALLPIALRNVPRTAEKPRRKSRTTVTVVKTEDVA